MAPAGFSIEQAPEDCCTRAGSHWASFDPASHLALRAFLRNLTWDDRLLDRRVAFKHCEEDTEATVSALYYVLRTGVKRRRRPAPGTRQLAGRAFRGDSAEESDPGARDARDARRDPLRGTRGGRR